MYPLVLLLLMLLVLEPAATAAGAASCKHATETSRRPLVRHEASPSGRCMGTTAPVVPCGAATS